MNELGVHCYVFDGFRLVPEERLLLENGAPVPLPPKVFDALLLLLENPGHLIEKDDFLDSIWPDAFVEEATLTRTISSLRKALGETAENRFIETVPKSGYRFIAAVTRETIDEALPHVTDSETGGTVSELETGRSESPGESRPPDTPVPAVGTLQKFIYSRPMLLAIGVTVAITAFILITSWNWTSPPPKRIRSIAVMPFRQIGNTKLDEMLLFGMTDSLITRISNLGEIIVRPTSAVSRYTGEKIEAGKAGRELKVDAILEGTVQKIGDRVRINVQLIETNGGSSLWADRFDTELAHVFAVQDAISRQVIPALAVKLRGKMPEGVSEAGRANSEAYRQYLLGRYHWNKRTVDSLRKGITHFESALQKDPEFAPAYAGLADCYQLLAEYLALTPKVGFTNAKKYAKKALEIDPDLPEAHTSLGYTLAFYEWDWKNAEKEFRRAIALNANYATSRQWFGELLSALGRFEEAKTEFDRAVQLDPTSLIIQTDLAAYYFLTRRYDKAVSQARHVIALDQNFAYGYVFLWFSLEKQGKDKEAARAFLRSLELFGQPDRARELKKILNSEGVQAMWRKRVDQLNSPDNDEYVSAMWRALFHIRVGEKQKAIDWLERSYRDRDRWAINLKYSPEVDSLRTEPRFKSLISKIGI